MIPRLALALLLTGWLGYGAENPKMIPVIEQDGRAFVAAADLERDAQIVVKTLPGADGVSVCIQDRCAVVKDYRRSGGEILVSTTALTTALGLSTLFSDDRKSVSLGLRPDLGR